MSLGEELMSMDYVMSHALGDAYLTLKMNEQVEKGGQDVCKAFLEQWAISPVPLWKLQFFA